MAFLRQVFRRHIRVPRGSQAPEVAAAVAALGLDAMSIYSETQAQAVIDKVDEIVASLKAAGLMLDA